PRAGPDVVGAARPGPRTRYRRGAAAGGVRDGHRCPAAGRDPAGEPRRPARAGSARTRLGLASNASKRGDRARVPRSYQVVRYGCQMNVHDSERLSGLLEAAGYVRAADGDTADVVVFNTCAVRENADNRLYGNLGHLRPTKTANPGMQIA